jgi:N-acetylmuramoyl-L-alanine amidase
MTLLFIESLLWLTLNVYHEARGEPEVGKLAVAHVTLNRAREEQKRVAEIVKEPNQFSWTDQRKFSHLELNPLQDSLRVALKAMTTPDFTGGATYFHRHDLSPDWTSKMTFTARYGSHKFYRDSPNMTMLSMNQTNITVAPLLYR